MPGAPPPKSATDWKCFFVTMNCISYQYDDHLDQTLVLHSYFLICAHFNLLNMTEEMKANVLKITSQ